MNDEPTFTRQWLLVRALSARGSEATVQQLADEFGVSQKTIRRDFDALSRVGFQLVQTTGSHGKKRWRIDNSNLQGSLAFTFEEVAALYLGRSFLEPFAGTVFWNAASSAYRKIRAGLGPDRIHFLEKLAMILHRTTNGASDYSERGEQIDHLMVAIEDQRVATMAYHSASAEACRPVVVHPLGLVFHKTALYLVAFAPEHAEVRHYKVDRIEKVEVFNDRFNTPEGFNLSSHLNESFGVYHQNQPLQLVRIRFNAGVARYVKEHRWHESQRSTDLPDGGVLVEMQLADLHEVRAWIMSFGAKVLVEEPQELRQQILHEARTIVDHLESTS